MRRSLISLSVLSIFLAPLACNGEDLGQDEPAAGSIPSSVGGEDSSPSGDVLEQANNAQVAEVVDDEEGAELVRREPIEVPQVYEFVSRFAEGSSVSYSGQVLRQVLMSELSSYVASLDERVQNGLDTSEDAVLSELMALYEFESELRGEDKIAFFNGEAEAAQSVFDDVSTGANLTSKIAGMDGGDRYHKDFWAEFSGWSEEALAEEGGSIHTPNGFVHAIFATLNSNAMNENTRTMEIGWSEESVLGVHHTDAGVNLQQLLEKFLWGALAFSQGVDDYLDEGLGGNNTEPAEEGASYTALEHAWDEGFGYFGAARDCLIRSVEDIAQDQSSDANGDGVIDLKSEYNFGAAVSAAQRDSSSRSGTNFTQAAMDAFLLGRTIIANAEELTEEEMDSLLVQRDTIALTWEMTLSASVIHYINQTLAHYAVMETGDYSFEQHSSDWSALKGLAMGLQFSPHSPLAEETYSELHGLLGDAPLLTGDSPQDFEDYQRALLEARELLQAVYEFSKDDVEGW